MSMNQDASACSSENPGADPAEPNQQSLGCTSSSHATLHSDSKFVLLLKSAKGDQGEDPYQKLLVDAGIKATLCPVLTFEFLNLDLYMNQMSRPEDFSAIVFTSQQAVKATRMVLESGGEMQPLKKWRCYVVGPATATEAKNLGFLPQGEDSGSAEALSEILLKDLRHLTRPILYPCGNLKRDTLPKKMKENGLELHEITVYQTIPRVDLEPYIHDLVNKEGTPSHMVFFSPSGVEATLSVLHSVWFRKHQIKFIAIGQTTSQAMSKHLVPITGVCSQPDPRSLLDVIRTKM
ncbi:uroporphyrinogen-III synthase-like [Ylistrum balloti]|uniref:uroporphyrinogen-III synthase-like n=1 Tax=Ylistrum balloti TaxID=509963 RepID=UPI002905B912|nr:uroporphyrinogen-III synthase-like [Ylistrum balloti]